MFDVIIVGGGPAGLNAALWLGRCRRRVLVLDSGEPRNARSRWVSGFLTRDGTLPFDLRRIAREELARYDSVELREATVERVGGADGAFEAVLAGGEEVRGRKLILATGLLNDVPDFPGAREFYGRGVYPCPYCDGWEHRDEMLVAFARGGDAHGMALELTVWSDRITLVTHGPGEIPPHHREDLDARGITVIEDRIEALEGDPDGDGLTGIRFETGRTLDAKAIFHAFHECRQSPLIGQMGCEISDKGAVETGHCERTNVPGLFVPGDASRRVKFAIVAAAEGSMAAFAANTELLKEDLAMTRGLGRREAAE
jgi:thioredoxin reductase